MPEWVCNIFFQLFPAYLSFALIKFDKTPLSRFSVKNLNASRERPLNTARRGSLTP